MLRQLVIFQAFFEYSFILSIFNAETKDKQKCTRNIMLTSIDFAVETQKF